MRSAKLSAALVACIALMGIGGVGVAAAADPADFGIASFDVDYHDPSGAPLLQAGAHPDQTTSLNFNVDSHQLMNGSVRDIEVDLPAGFAGNPQALATCTQEEILLRDGICNPPAQVGILRLIPPAGAAVSTFPVYNMKAPDAQTAVLGSVVIGVLAKIVISPRTDGDYGLTARLSNLNQGIPLDTTELTIWGVPYDEVHDPLRYKNYGIGGAHINAPPKPFLSLPARCEPLVSELHADSWQAPGPHHPDGTADLSDPRWVSASSETPTLTGCEDLAFAPKLSARPTTNVADSPSGLDLALNLPQNADDPDGLAPANLRNVEVKLPEGLVVNPSGANGLGACTLTQIGYLGQSSERQVLRFPSPRSNSVVVSFEGESTAPIPATASAAEVAAALETLPGLAGNINLRQAPGGWTVTFTNALANVDVPALSGTVTDNATQLMEVTGESGGFNLALGGASTEGSFEASFKKDASSIEASSIEGSFVLGSPVKGPGIAPGTTIESISIEGDLVGLSQPTTEEKGGAQLVTELPFGISIQRLQEALERIPTLGAGNVRARLQAQAGSTRSFQLSFVGALAGASPTITETNTLTGPGAGVVFTAQPVNTHDLEVSSVVRSDGEPHFDRNKPNCPENSKIGRVEVDTPAFPDPLKGSVYTMAPYDNPFSSLLGIYFTVEGHGIIAKIPAKVSADPQTGRLTNVVTESPQLPIENVRLKLDGGAAAVLRTPAACGTYATTSTLTPWSFPATPIVEDKDTYGITQAPPGGSCASDEGQRPNAPSFQAGSVSPVAGSYTPFTLKLARADGTQQLAGVDTTLPPGLLARLAGTTYCSDAALAAAAGKTGKAEQAAASCPASSSVGSVTVAAGAGPKPFQAPGAAYLAGPYKGAPLSLAVVTPAVAGPFDLGTVVVRNALYVDPTTARVHAVSDRFPTILQGIPLDIRSVELSLDRPQFTKNPTSCDPFAITGFASAPSGQNATLDSRFQVGECGRLKFGPKLRISLKGKTKRTGNPALTAVLKAPPNQANIAGTTVILPKTMFIDNAHISNPCTRVQFDAKQCPAKSILGRATAFSPLLDEPLRGPVYFRSNGGDRELPDLVADLDGQIHVTLVGFIDSVPVKGSTESTRTRTRFLNVPDAPVSKFVLRMAGGKRGLLENSVNLCARPQTATVQMQAHNADARAFEQRIGTSCGKKARKGKKQKRSGSR